MRRAASILLAAALAACGNESARAPNPTQYRWPDRFAYKVDYVASPQRNNNELLRYAETKIMRFAADNDGAYVVISDSVLKTSQAPGGPLSLVTLATEDTLAWRLGLGPLGEFRDPRVGCDPVVPACAAVLPSQLPLELRRLVPRLSPWPVPRGSAWMDTVAFDDIPRVGGTRGTVITTYSAPRDTTISGESYWMVSWISVRRAYPPGDAAAVSPEPPVQEAGLAFIGKSRALPVYATWAGTVLAPTAMRALGATGMGYRGRAYLEGSVFDSLFSVQR